MIAKVLSLLFVTSSSSNTETRDDSEWLATPANALETWRCFRYTFAIVRYSVTYEEGMYVVRCLRPSANNKKMLEKAKYEDIEKLMTKMGYRREAV